MRNLRVLFGLLLVVVFPGCENNDVSRSKMYLKEIIDPSYSQEFEYEGGRLISYKFLFGERISTVIEFTYQGDQLKTINSSKDNGQSHTIELIYGSNGLRETEVGTYRQDGEVIVLSTINFFYDEDQNLKSKYRTSTDTNLFPSETEFEWANGNIIRKNYFYFDSSGKHYGSSDDLQFDSKVNYTNNDLAFLYISVSDEAVLSKNNFVGTPNRYSYNENGYPIGYTYTMGGKDYFVQMNYE